MTFTTDHDDMIWFEAECGFKPELLSVEGCGFNIDVDNVDTDYDLTYAIIILENCENQEEECIDQEMVPHYGVYDPGYCSALFVMDNNWGWPYYIWDNDFWIDPHCPNAWCDWELLIFAFE